MVMYRPDIEAQILLLNSITTLLRHERFQKLLVARRRVQDILFLLVFSYTQDPDTVKDLNSTILKKTLNHESQEPEDEQELATSRQELIKSLWDLSALQMFQDEYPPDSEFMQTLIKWLSAEEPPILVQCACEVLRSIATSDRVVIQLAQEYAVHEAVIRILETHEDILILTEALRLLYNLATPLSNKKLIADAHAFKAISSIWTKSQSSPELHIYALNTTRRLMENCSPNVQLFLQNLPNNSRRISLSDAKDSYLTHFLSISNNDNPTGDLNIRIETGRLVVAIWRAIQKDSSLSTPLKQDLTSGAIAQAQSLSVNIAASVLTLITDSEKGQQAMTPTDRAWAKTEGWLGLALIAGSNEGCEAVFDALREKEKLDLLKARVNSSGETAERDNIRILAVKMAEHYVSFPNFGLQCGIQAELY